MDLSLTKEQQLLILGFIVALVVGLGVAAFRQLVPEAPSGIIMEQTAPAEDNRIMVHVCGAVGAEGVFRVKPGSRLLEVIEIAGGPLVDADISALNLAEVVKDGQKIIVPSRLPVSQSNQPGAVARININTAGVDEFDSLPGIGKATAEKIVELRRKQGPFVRLEQLLEVPRFGKAKLEKMKERLTL
ncbi:MAG: ComEA family DNA-binding protein [Candidatus Margulisbacteria bacterium]|nr:ComEA family DNA-binding protein [Candidatus Margulisiibacteriota bacterium]